MDELLSEFLICTYFHMKFPSGNRGIIYIIGTGNFFVISFCFKLPLKSLVVFLDHNLSIRNPIYYSSLGSNSRSLGDDMAGPF